MARIIRHFAAILGDSIVFRSSATMDYVAVRITSHGSTQFSKTRRPGDIRTTEVGASVMKWIREQAQHRVRANSTRANPLFSPDDSWIPATEANLGRLREDVLSASFP